MKCIKAKMGNHMILTDSCFVPKKQKGATLFTALVFLALMTIVTVSATKISILDVLVAGNNQQRVFLYQKAAREIDAHAKPAKLIKLLQSGQDYQAPWAVDYPVNPDNPDSDEKVTNRVLKYGCGAIAGLATSQGSDSHCRLFDFEVKTKRKYSSARERHVRGGGKEYPNASRNNLNNY